MLKFPKFLGDTWYESLVNGLLLVLFLPIIAVILVLFAPFMIIDTLWSWLRKEPKPIIPAVLTSPDLSIEQMATECTAQAKSLVPNVKAKNDKAKLRYVLTSPRLGKRTVNFSYDNWGMAILIDDLNCYEWDTSQSDSIDLFFWVAISVLRNGVYPVRSRLGRLGYWTKSDELGVWVKVQREGSTYDGIEFYKQPPTRVMQAMKHPHLV